MLRAVTISPPMVVLMDLMTDPREIGAFFRKKIMERHLRIKDVADRIGVDASYISHMLAGRVNIVGSDYFKPLVQLLGLSAEEVRQLDPSAVFEFSHEGQTASTAPPLFEISPSLQQAIDLYGEQFPGLRLPKVQRNLSLARFYDGSGPQTPAEWLSYYNSISRWIED